MCISYINSLLTTYTDRDLVIIGDFNEKILHESKQKHIQVVTT